MRKENIKNGKGLKAKLKQILLKNGWHILFVFIDNSTKKLNHLWNKVRWKIESPYSVQRISRFVRMKGDESRGRGSSLCSSPYLLFSSHITHSLFLSLSHTHTLSLSHTHTHTNTHTHTSNMDYFIRKIECKFSTPLYLLRSSFDKQI